MKASIQTGDDIVFVFAVMKAEDYAKVKLPNGCAAKALEIGKIEDLCDMETCKGWGAWVGISLGKLAKRICPEIFMLKNIPPVPSTEILKGN